MLDRDRKATEIFVYVYTQTYMQLHSKFVLEMLFENYYIHIYNKQCHECVLKKPDANATLIAANMAENENLIWRLTNDQEHKPIIQTTGRQNHPYTWE